MKTENVESIRAIYSALKKKILEQMNKDIKNREERPDKSKIDK